MNKTQMQNAEFFKVYSSEFYDDQQAGSLASAKVVVPLILEKYSVNSVVDIGCGVGTWLSVFAAHQVKDICGVDGDYVDRSKLHIPREFFAAADLNSPLSLNRRFDLAVCLEVAEHLPMASASVLVGSLTQLSNIVLFSAAVPGQGGANHINEQWPDYWDRLFGDRGFRSIDWIRPKIWNSGQVDWWYAQNIFVYASEKSSFGTTNCATATFCNTDGPLRVVHPGMFEHLRKHYTSLLEDYHTPGMLWCVRATAQSIRSALIRRVPWLTKR